MESTMEADSARATSQRPSYQAYRLLQVGFVAAPILAGLDKFFNILTDWEQYLAPFIGDLIGASTFMAVVGIIEIVAGIGVAIKPRIFAYVVAAWLVGIILNLLLIPGFYDVAMRDLGLALGALALGRLSQEFSK
ncbi:MAG TPA: hypothetical protein VKP65_17015 [Rhodothermales bacterium]|nr:hypothetical protein [Rhodothermales bacterium]